MQYKIPIQIENEDTIVLGLSLRQLVIMMVFGGVAYAIFKALESQIGSVALVLAILIALMGVAIALVKISEMTFLPLILNYLRLSLNGKTRVWVQGVDSYDELSIWQVQSINENPQQWWKNKESFAIAVEKENDFAEKLKNL